MWETGTGGHKDFSTTLISYSKGGLSGFCSFCIKNSLQHLLCPWEFNCAIHSTPIEIETITNIMGLAQDEMDSNGMSGWMNGVKVLLNGV